MTKKNSINLSPKHGVNPSVLCCATCGKDYGVALLGKMKDDAEAPRNIIDGSMCDECVQLREKGILIVEAVPGKQQNPYGQVYPIPTGRLVVLKESALDDGLFDEGMTAHLRKTRVLFMRPEQFTKNFDTTVDDSGNITLPGADDEGVVN